jgi:hypothetical protein
MKNSIRSFILLLIFLLTARSALANGVPVIFGVVVFHVVIINIIVILIETYLLRNLSKGRVRALFVIIANLASLFLAYALTTKFISSYFNNQWFGLEGHGIIPKKTFIRGVFVFILLTILIEWPFYHLAQKNKKNLLVSLKFSTIINLITNIPIALFYLLGNLYYDPGD